MTTTVYLVLMLLSPGGETRTQTWIEQPNLASCQAAQAQLQGLSGVTSESFTVHCTMVTRYD